MEKDEVEEILGVFEGYREKFPYIKDGFALTRILDETGDGKCVGDIRKGPNGRLLNLPLVREFIRLAGSGKLTPDLFFYRSPDPTDLYLVTLDQWGSDRKYWGRSWEQMARPGFNLVVQLNLSGIQLERMRRVDPGLLEYLTPRYSSHPVRDDGNITVGWARVDMDIRTGVALIEEIQSDWIRDAVQLRNTVTKLSVKEDINRATLKRQRKLPRKHWLEYLDSADFRRVETHWAEATLEATCQFLRKEIGITETYFYDFDTGCRFKGLLDDDWQPPRSLYSNLPKRYGMERVAEVPPFLMKKRSRHLRKIISQSPAFFWKLSDTSGETEEAPPGSGPGKRSIGGSGHSPLPTFPYFNIPSKRTIH